LGNADVGDPASVLFCPFCGTTHLCRECEEICMAITSDIDRSSAPRAVFSESLEHSLGRALAIAQERHHDHATEQHLLLALTDDPDAAAVMRACEVDLDRLRRAVWLSLSTSDENPLASGATPLTSSGFQAIVKRTVVHAQSAGRGAATGADILAQMFAEPAAAALLREHGMTRYDATRYISHGIAKGNRIAPTPQSPADKSSLAAEVRLLNDDFTPMEFVVHVLERVFDEDRESATRVMLEIHRNGVGTCGIYPYEAAAAKVAEVLKLAREHQHPLECLLMQTTSA
jgi:ATP-dependent Clp protease adapter protein ClpS